MFNMIGKVTETGLGGKSRNTKQGLRLRMFAFVAVIAISCISKADGLQIDAQGKLIVEEEDMKVLIKSINVDKDRGGKVFGDMFKAEVDKGPSYADLKPEDYAYHHIIPNNQAQGLVNKKSKAAVEDYINQHHIKSVFIKHNIVGNKPKDQHGKAIHASISWNPHNLVRGPAGKHRCDDPKQKLDVKLLGRQTQAYQNAAKPFVTKDPQNLPTLEKFGRIPATVTVKFTLQPKNNCYYVEKANKINRKWSRERSGKANYLQRLLGQF